MRYLSVCSGIEAATVAWHNLGWTPVGFSEIEPFPSAVLAHHYPNVPNFGDMTQHEQWPIEPGSIDLLVGGTPCQAFSVAGLRGGLSDPRGGLMLTYLEIARRLRPKWIVWENVPGVLSSGQGRDFGSFLGALGELRYGWAYRVIDAQYCRVDGRWPKAVPQRRRRVFVVGCDLERDPRGRERAAEVLALGTGLRWHLEESRKTRKAAPSDAEAGARAGLHETVGALCADTHPGAYSGQDAYTGRLIPEPIGYRWQSDRDGLVQDGTAPACCASSGSSGFHEMNHPVVVQQPVPIQDGREIQKAQNGIGVGDQGDPAYTLDTTGAQAVGQPVPYDLFQITAPVNRQNRKPGDPCHTLARDNAAHAAVAFANRTRDGIKVPEIMADGIVPALTNPGDGGRSDAINVAVAFDWQSGGDSRGLDPKDTAQLQRCQTPAVAQAMTVRRLLPVECERLQGFPDDYTLIPWRKKAAADCPDGPRYKALGNSMAVNCMAWIGERIAAVENHNAN